MVTAITQESMPAATAPLTQPTENRLNSLTSLRFVAAAMIVVFHSVGIFGLDPHSSINKFPLYQGVSFFFILSGFILTHVYRNLGGTRKILEFYAARIARIWPVFLVTAVLTYAGAPSSMMAKAPQAVAAILVSQFFMVQSWVPDRLFYQSLNAPSWSVSTEFFFYLAFPWLIKNLQQNWLKKLLLVSAIPLLLLLNSFTGIADQFLKQAGLNASEVIYFNPLCRIFEFFFGVLTCLFLARINTKRLKTHVITALEITALAVCAFELSFIGQLLNTFALVRTRPELLQFFTYSGNDVGFIFLIAVVGLERGVVAKILNFPAFIFLGEISYSVYLFHYPMLLWFLKNSSAYKAIPHLSMYVVFWSALLTASAVSFLTIEKPSRKILKTVLVRLIAKIA